MQTEARRETKQTKKLEGKRKPEKQEVREKAEGEGLPEKGKIRGDLGGSRRETKNKQKKRLQVFIDMASTGVGCRQVLLLYYGM